MKPEFKGITMGLAAIVLTSIGIDSCNKHRKITQERLNQSGLLELYSQYPYDFGHTIDSVDVNGDGLTDKVINDVFDRPEFVEIRLKNGSYALHVARNNSKGTLDYNWADIPEDAYLIDRK